LKASDYVPLLVIGSVFALNAFSHRNDLDVKQQRYASREDCEVDWGAPEYCSRDASESSDYHTRYVGPRYYWDRDIGRPIEVLPNGETRALRNTSIGSAGSVRGQSMSVGSYSRGGFGSFSHGFSAGG